MSIVTLGEIDIAPILSQFNILDHDMQWTNFGHKGSQVGLQYRAGEDPWTSAVGRSKGNEHTYTELNPFFANTIFEELIHKYKLIRSRLMWVGPYACYSMHKDETPRIHIPLITNPDCYFIFGSGSLNYMPAGKVYWVDTTKTHTFANCSSENRLHLVGATLVR